jgi:hypothetical protein
VVKLRKMGGRAGISIDFFACVNSFQAILKVCCIEPWMYRTCIFKGAIQHFSFGRETIISFEGKDQKLLELQQQAMWIPNKMAADSSQIPPAGEVFTELY